MTNLAFIGNSEPASKLLEIFKKMTPNSSGIWGQIQGVNSYEEANYYAVIDYLPNNVRHLVDESKCIFLGAHPETMSAYHCQDTYKGFKMLDIAKGFAFTEWWIKYDYTYLTALKPPTKTNSLACIMSNSTGQKYHTIRRNYLEKFCDQYPVDVYGRIEPWGSIVSKYKGILGSYDPRGSATVEGNNHMTGKEQVYESYRYALEFDAQGEFYISERVLDCLLLWCKPLYWGGLGMNKLLPSKSHYYLDINGDGKDIMSIINSNDYEESLPDIAKARDILLNQLNPWAMVHKAIYETYT